MVAPPTLESVGGLTSLGDHAACFAGTISIDTDCSICFEMQIAFDRKAKAAANRLEFADPDASQFGIAKTQIAKTKGNVGILGVSLGQKPGCACIWSEELDDGLVVDGVLAVEHPLLVDPALAANWSRMDCVKSFMVCFL